MDPIRIAELTRRLQADPSSIAFAQLAEEHRRAGQFDEAVSVCRDGLQRHPGYLSARVTLGRSLAELGQTEEAEREFEHVLRSAPDNLAAIRGIAEIHQKQGRLDRALVYYRRALALARYDPELDETVQAVARELGSEPQPPGGEGLSFAQAERELLDAASRVPAVTPGAPRVDFDALLRSLGHEPDAPAPPIVEAWLSNTPITLPGADRPGGSQDPPLPARSARATDASVADADLGRGGSQDPPLAPAGLGSDLLARLEAELRQLEQRPPPTFASPAADARVDAIVIAQLERWLGAIAGRRLLAIGRNHQVS